jgi:putative transcriptional regulator
VPRVGRDEQGRLQVQIEWRLRKVMASRNVWTPTELRDLLAQHAGFEISLQSASDLVKKPPAQVKVRTLQALCTTLRCTPNELFGIDVPHDVSLTEPNDTDSASKP